MTRQLPLSSTHLGVAEAEADGKTRGLRADASHRGTPVATGV
ncbi:hypothetical protein NST84_01125 [Paenibacillus sp. FSL R7-0345]